MRLLKLGGPNGLSLVEVPTHNDLPYAILSHTWRHGQEVTYQDLINGDGKNKPGYDKIKFCGEQALKDGFLYFWVDTCCIDKSDQAELATAINSMFRWYRNAKKCYVYLADVSAPGDEAESQADQSTWEAAFRKSRWFTRGWTLQELIAPAAVEFFSKESKLLGDKMSLEMLIHEITGIPIKALQGNPFSDFSVEEREEWAAKRHTTEQEDIVYCLIGLCEVSMPLIYGEGKETARKRLEVAVKDLSSNSGKQKDQTDDKVHFMVPFERNLRFTGRESQLAILENKLFKQTQTTRLAIRGLGGVGKTQLVLELIYRTKDKHRNCTVIWILATNMESLEQAYLEVARQLSIPGWEENKPNVKRLMQKHLSEETSEKWLLVFDNADDIDMWINQARSKHEHENMTDFLPRSKQGNIVFTTRDRRIAVKLAQNNVLEVPEMDGAVAIDLLRKCLVDSDLVNDKPATIALLNELTCLPLAIVQAAAYINENGIAIADYVSLLEAQEEEVIELLSEDFENDGRYHNVKNPVATTWLISFEQIRHRDPLAAEYLSFMACINSKDIPQCLLPAGQSRKKEMEAIGTLDAYSFINKRTEILALDLHRLVHLATRNWLREQKQITQWTETAITRLQEMFLGDQPRDRNLWRRFLPHIQYALVSGVIEHDEPKRVDLMWSLGTCLYIDGRYDEAEVQFVEALKFKKKLLGQEHPSTLIIMSTLASTFRNQGRWKEAEELNVIVIEMMKKVLGQEHPDTLISMSKLASTYRDQGRWKEAEDLDVLVLKTQTKVMGQEHHSTLVSMGNLALTFNGQGRWKEAEELNVIVIEMMKEVLGREHPDTLISMGNLASTYRDQGRWKEAEDLDVLVLKTQTKVMGQEHHSTLVSMGNLALTFNGQGRWEEAEDLQILVVETIKEVLGQEHPNTLISMGNLASIYWYQGCLKEAEELNVIVIEMMKEVLGREHPDTLTSMANLAFMWKEQGEDKRALDLMEQCVALRSKIIGTNHPHTLSCRTVLLEWQTEELEIGALVDRE